LAARGEKAIAERNVLERARTACGFAVFYVPCMYYKVKPRLAYRKRFFVSAPVVTVWLRR